MQYSVTVIRVYILYRPALRATYDISTKKRRANIVKDRMISNFANNSVARPFILFQIALRRA